MESAELAIEVRTQERLRYGYARHSTLSHVPLLFHRGWFCSHCEQSGASEDATLLPDPRRSTMACRVGLILGVMLAGATGFTLPHTTLAHCTLQRQQRPPGLATITAKADFSGEWEMDLSASEALGPTLRALGINRVLAAVIARLGVRQSITQDNESLSIVVKTTISESEIALLFGGTTTQTPGLSGGMTDTVSRWLDEQRLETRQALEEGSPPKDDAFVTVRSLLEGGSVLQEDCVVLRQGMAVDGASVKRLLRRVA